MNKLLRHFFKEVRKERKEEGCSEEGGECSRASRRSAFALSFFWGTDGFCSASVRFGGSAAASALCSPVAARFLFAGLSFAAASTRRHPLHVRTSLKPAIARTPPTPTDLFRRTIADTPTFAHPQPLAVATLPSDQALHSPRKRSVRSSHEVSAMSTDYESSSLQVSVQEPTI